MDFETLRAMRPKDRPRWFVPRFLHRRAGPWVFMILMTPVVIGAVAGVVRGSVVFHTVVAVLGSGMAAILSSALVLGMTSSKWGTYFRASEPTRYWADVAFAAVCYFVSVGYALA